MIGQQVRVRGRK